MGIVQSRVDLFTLPAESVELLHGTEVYTFEEKSFMIAKYEKSFQIFERNIDLHKMYGMQQATESVYAL